VFFEQNEMIIVCGDEICDIMIMSSGVATVFDSDGDYASEAEREASFGHEALCVVDQEVPHWDYSLVATEFSELLTIPVQALTAAFEFDPIFAKLKARAEKVPTVVDEAAASGLPASEQLSELDRLRLKQAFDVADDNKSGEIDMEEFFILIRKIMEEEKEKPPNNQDLVDIFVQADTDGGGTVDWEEFASLYLKVKKGLVKALPKHLLAKVAKAKESASTSGSNPAAFHNQHLESHHKTLTDHIEKKNQVLVERLLKIEAANTASIYKLEANIDKKLERMEKAINALVANQNK